MRIASYLTTPKYYLFSRMECDGAWWCLGRQFTVDVWIKSYVIAVEYTFSYS